MGLINMDEHYCDDGLIFNMASRKNEPCPICKKERKETIKENEIKGESNLEEMLGFGDRVLNKEYEFESIISGVEKVFLDGKSLEHVEDELDRLYGMIVNKEPVKESICFGLGIKGNIERLAYPILVKAWESGYSVGRLISALEYNRMVNREDPEVEELLDKDIVMVWITDGCSSREIDSVKGFMQTRSIRGKGTILVTTWLIQACSGLLYAMGEPISGLAKPVFVSYKKSSNEEKESSYIQRLKGVENTSALENSRTGRENTKKENVPVVSFKDLLG